MAAIAYLLRHGVLGEIYNIGGGCSLKNKELVLRVRTLMGIGADLVQSVEDRPGHDRRYALDDSKLRRLGFKFQYPFDQALEETITWYQNNQSWWQPLKKSKNYDSYFQKQYRQNQEALV